MVLFTRLLHASSTLFCSPETLSGEGRRNYGRTVFRQGLSQELLLVPVKTEQFPAFTRQTDFWGTYNRNAKEIFWMASVVLL